MPILKSGAPLSSIRSADGAISLEDFYAIPWTTKCMFMPTRTPWPADSINMILPPIPWAGKKPLRPADWLAKFRRVEQMSWVPGEPEVIEGRLLYESGWRDRPGAKCLNVYFPPTIVLGDPAKAGKWVDHIRLVYPNDHEHSETGWRNGRRTRGQNQTMRSCSAARQALARIRFSRRCAKRSAHGISRTSPLTRWSRGSTRT